MRGSEKQTAEGHNYGHYSRKCCYKALVLEILPGSSLYVMSDHGIYQEVHADNAGDRCENGKSLENDQARGHGEDVPSREGGGHDDGSHIGQSKEGCAPPINSNLSEGVARIFQPENSR